jgi:hypothetical protein
MSNIPDDIYIKNLKKIGSGIKNIHIVENFLSEFELSVLYNEATSDIYNKNTTGQWAGRVSDPKLLSPESRSILKSAHEKILSIAKNFYDVDMEFVWNNEGQSIIRWPVGCSMGEHIDDFAVFHYNIASLLYINDNYEGGEIKFNDYNLTIKPKGGTLILFPGNKYYAHEVLEVVNGERYTSAVWMKFSESSFAGFGQALGLKDIEDWKNINWEDNIKDWKKNED